VMGECPSIFDTTAIGTPAASITDAAVAEVVKPDRPEAGLADEAAERLGR